MARRENGRDGSVDRVVDVDVCCACEGGSVDE